MNIQKIRSSIDDFSYLIKFFIVFLSFFSIFSSILTIIFFAFDGPTIIKRNELSFASASAVRGQPNDLWADVVIGQGDFSEGAMKERSADKVFNPGGVAIDRSVQPNRVYVSDGGNSRVLAYKSLGFCSNNQTRACTDDTDCASGGVCNLTINRDADKVFGQPNFLKGSCNNDANFTGFPDRASASASSLCLMPQGQISPSEGGAFLFLDTDANHNLYVPDWMNNRVLMYKDPFGPATNGAGDTIADFVWGQDNFSQNLCNKSLGHESPRIDTLCFAYEGQFMSSDSISVLAGLDVDNNGNLWVADTLNSRVLRFPFSSSLGRPANLPDLVLGRSDFNTKNDYGPTSSLSEMWLPGAVKVHPSSTKVFVSDTYNDDDSDGKLGRMLLFQAPFSNGMQAQKWGDPSKPFNFPNGIEFTPDGTGVWVSDFHNHLIELWSLNGLEVKGVLYNDRWATTGWSDQFVCNSPVNVCYQDGSIGSLGMTSAGDLFVSSSGQSQDVIRFKAPIPTPTVNHPVGADFRMFYPPEGPNLFSKRTFWAPMGVEAIGNQLIVADNKRLMFWNNANSLSNNWSEATGIVNSNNGSYQDPWSYSRIRADKAGHLYVIHLYQVEVFDLPLKGGLDTQGNPRDVPIRIIGNQLKDLNGNTLTMSSDYAIGGLHPADDGSYLWLVHPQTNRAVRILNPLSSDPRVDVILGQKNSFGTSCNFGDGDGYPKPDSLCLPGAIFLDNYGNVYVADGSLEIQGNARLLMYSGSKFPVGSSTMVFAPAADGIWFYDSHQTRYSVLEPVFSLSNKMVIGFNPYLFDQGTNTKHSILFYDNIATSGWRNPTGIFNDYLVFPYTMDFDESGNLYVADMNRSRVLKYFTPFGSSVPSPLPKPTLVSPVNNSLNLATTKPVFDWSDVPSSSQYSVQVSKNAAFTNVVINKSVTVSGYTAQIALVQGTTYYWRVRAKIGSVFGSWSETWKFRIAKPPTTPVLLSPANGSTAIELLPTFKWKASVPVPSKYQIQISKASNFSTLVYNKNNILGTVTQLKLPVSLIAKTTYYWRVRSVNSFGDWSSWSSRWSFKTK